MRNADVEWSSGESQLTGPLATEVAELTSEGPQQLAEQPKDIRKPENIFSIEYDPDQSPGQGLLSITSVQQWSKTELQSDSLGASSCKKYQFLHNFALRICL